MKFLNTIAFILIVLLSGCSKPASKVVGSLVKEGHQPKKYSKLAVLAFMPSEEGRARMENAISDQLRINRIPSIPTYEIFPLVNNPEVMDEYFADKSEEEVEREIIDAVKRQNIDALMIITLLDVQENSRYVPSTGYSGYYYVPGYDPVYTYSYYGYFHYAYTSVHRQGYYKQDSKYFLESNLYDIDNEGLIWTGQTLTKDPRSIPEEIGNVAVLIANQVVEKKVVDTGLSLDDAKN